MIFGAYAGIVLKRTRMWLSVVMIVGIMMTLMHSIVVAETEVRINVVIDGSYVLTSIPPVIINDRVYVAPTGLLEMLQLNKSWNENTRKATFCQTWWRYGEEYPGCIVLYPSAYDGNGDGAGSPIISVVYNSVDEDVYAVDVKPRIIDGYTYIPLRFFAEAFDWGVEWDAITRTVIINRSGHSTPSDWHKVSDVLAQIDTDLGYSPRINRFNPDYPWHAYPATIRRFKELMVLFNNALDNLDSYGGRGDKIETVYNQTLSHIEIYRILNGNKRLVAYLGPSGFIRWFEGKEDFRQFRSDLNSNARANKWGLSFATGITTIAIGGPAIGGAFVTLGSSFAFEAPMDDVLSTMSDCAETANNGQQIGVLYQPDSHVLNWDIHGCFIGYTDLGLFTRPTIVVGDRRY